MEVKKIDLFTIVMFVIALFTIILQIYPPKTIKDQATSLIYFLAIVGYITFLWVINSITKKIKMYINKINTNEKEIAEIKNKMNEEKRFNEIDKRLSILEFLKKNKRGFVIDPKWIFLAILLVLFYLYLRSLGFVK